MEMAEFYSAEFLESEEFYKMFDAETYIDSPIHGRSEERTNNGKETNKDGHDAENGSDKERHKMSLL